MITPLRLIFMGTPEFSAGVLAHLLTTPHRVVAAYSQPPRPAGRGKKETPSPVQILAEKQGIPVHTPLSLKTAEEQEILAGYNADAALVVAYGLLLPEAVLAAPRLGCLNIHTSKLPRWRGAAPIQRAIMAGDAETAVTLMLMDKGLDTGPVLLERPVAITPGMTSGQLHDAMKQIAGPLAVEALEGVAAGTLHPRPQASEGTSYAAKITKEEALIDWNRPATEIVNHIHGLNPAPGAYFMHQGERIKVWNAVAGKSNGQAPGSISADFTIACGEGSIHPLTLQREGKKAMPLAEFLKGMA